MSRSSYMPDALAAQVLWSQEFVDSVGPVAGDYGVPAALMAEFTLLNTAVQTAWAISQTPATRTKSSIEARNVALANMRAAARNLVSIIQGTPSVTNQMKIDAGLTVRDTTPTRIDPPSTKPYMERGAVDARTFTLVLNQEPGVRGKPAGVTGALLFTSMTGVEGGSDWQYYASVTKTKVSITFPPSPTTDTVYLLAQWVNAKDETGPASDVLKVVLPPGGLSSPEPVQAMKAA